jgi:tRNA(Ser,Leu) C12 N-acetylase TAN1
VDNKCPHSKKYPKIKKNKSFRVIYNRRGYYPPLITN